MAQNPWFTFHGSLAAGHARASCRQDPATQRLFLATEVGDLSQEELIARRAETFGFFGALTPGNFGWAPSPPGSHPSTCTLSLQWGAGGIHDFSWSPCSGETRETFPLRGSHHKTHGNQPPWVLARGFRLARDKGARLLSVLPPISKVLALDTGFPGASGG